MVGASDGTMFDYFRERYGRTVWLVRTIRDTFQAPQAFIEAALDTVDVLVEQDAQGFHLLAGEM